MDEVIDVYLPLSRLLSLHAVATNDRDRVTDPITTHLADAAFALLLPGCEYAKVRVVTGLPVAYYRDAYQLSQHLLGIHEIMLEGRTLPGEEVADFVANKCGVKPEQLFLVIAPTASLVGSIQVAARSAETGMHKLVELGFDVRSVISASGTCPLAPVAADDLHAIGRTNDAILYGAQVFYTVRAEERSLAELVTRVPSESSRDYGTPFHELFQRYNGDFYQIDRMLFSPAQVEINNLSSGSTFRAGRLNPALLRSSLLES